MCMSHDARTIKYNPFMGQSQSKGMFSPMYYCPQFNLPVVTFDCADSNVFGRGVPVWFN